MQGMISDVLAACQPPKALADDDEAFPPMTERIINRWVSALIAFVWQG